LGKKNRHTVKKQMRVNSLGLIVHKKQPRRKDIDMVIASIK